MAAQSGNLATFSWHNGTQLTAIAQVAAINSVTLDGASIDVTELSADVYRKFIAGKYQVTFSLELFYSDGAHAALTGDFLSRTARAFAIGFNDADFSGSAFLTNCTLSAAIDDAMRISITAQVVGAVTITSVSP